MAELQKRRLEWVTSRGPVVVPGPEDEAGGVAAGAGAGAGAGAPESVVDGVVSFCFFLQASLRRFCSACQVS